MYYFKPIKLKVFFIIIFTIIFNSLSAQDTPVATLKYKGRNLHRYIDQNLTYSSELIEKEIEGQVKTKITVSPKGKITSINYSGWNHEYFKTHINDLLKPTSGKWEPKVKNGVPVESQVVINIYFSLEQSQNYTKDSTIVEYLVYLSRYVPNPQKDKERLDKILSKRPGYNEYIIGLDKLEKNELVETIKMFVKAESLGYKGSDLYLNRGIAYLRMKRPNFGCKDWLKSEKYGNKTATEYLNKYCKSVEQNK